MKELNFVFEDLKNHVNLTACKDLNTSGIARFTPSPISISLSNRYGQFWKDKVNFHIEHYQNTKSKDS